MVKRNAGSGVLNSTSTELVFFDPSDFATGFTPDVDDISGNGDDQVSAIKVTTFPGSNFALVCARKSDTDPSYGACFVLEHQGSSLFRRASLRFGHLTCVVIK